jgi:WS/DGAT/MGAT family acyltransferase
MLPTDALFWYAEEATPELRPLVASLYIFDRAPDRGRFRASIERAIALVPRLRQRVVEAPWHVGLPAWEEDPYFDLDYHLREVVLPEPASERHLFEFAAAVFAEPLDHLRPLWEGYLIEGLEDGRAAYFSRAHHSIMDGVGSVAVFDALTQAHRADPVRVPRRMALNAKRHSSTISLGAVVGHTLWGAAAAIGGATRLASRAILHPTAVADGAMLMVRSIRGLVQDFAAPMVKDPLATRTSGIGRRLDGISFSLSRMRRIKDVLGVTLNDLTLAAVAGAVGRYHGHRHVHVDVLQCMVPISLRQDDERHLLGNRVGMCNIALPVGEPDALIRLERIRSQTTTAKSDRRGAAYPVLMQAMGLLPGFALRAMVQATAGRINLICTNVPGPPAQRYMGGAKIETVYPFAPVVVGTPLSIALFSYGDAYAVGIDTDPAAIPDPQLLHTYLEDAVDELEHCAFSKAPVSRARSSRGKHAA